MPQTTSREAGYGGVGYLLNAVREHRAHSCPRPHRSDGRCWIDYSLRHDGRRPVIAASDGEHVWQHYNDHLSTGPARPMPTEPRMVLDPSWLLACELSDCAETVIQGRRVPRDHRRRRFRDYLGTQASGRRHRRRARHPAPAHRPRRRPAGHPLRTARHHRQSRRPRDIPAAARNEDRRADR
jgi:hypothetical protein